MTHREGRAAAIMDDAAAEACQGRCIPPHVSAVVRWREGRDQKEDGALQRRDMGWCSLPGWPQPPPARRAPPVPCRPFPATCARWPGSIAPMLLGPRGRGAPLRVVYYPETAKPGIAAGPAVAAPSWVLGGAKPGFGSNEEQWAPLTGGLLLFRLAAPPQPTGQRAQWHDEHEGIHVYPHPSPAGSTPAAATHPRRGGQDPSQATEHLPSTRPDRTLPACTPVRPKFQTVKSGKPEVVSV